MQWTKPDFQEITLNMEVTAYVNTDDAVRRQQPVVNGPQPAERATDHGPRTTD